MHRLDLTALAPVAEAHFTDLYGNAVKRFHDKYKNADGHVYYVNFNPVISDPRDKTILGLQSDRRHRVKNKVDLENPIFKSPKDAHADPVGTYAYPIDYVVNHWYDVDYGRDMPNLRVLKARLDPDKVLRLHNMTKEYFLEVMKRLNLEFGVTGEGVYFSRKPDDAMMIYEAVFENEATATSHFRVNSYGKTIFKLLQNKYTFARNPAMDENDEEDEDEDDEDYGYNSAGSFKYDGFLVVKTESTVSAQAQNEMARKAGFEAILDRASTPLEATIHPNEPEQIIFLSKRAYDVEEVFQIPVKYDQEKYGGAMPSADDTAVMSVKLAGKILGSLGDRIAAEVGVIKGQHGYRPLYNLSLFRHWLATEKIEPTPPMAGDPTIGTRAEDACYAWTTAKGRLICVAPYAGGGVLKVVDSQRTEDATEARHKARIRPGEDQSYIHDDLQSTLDNLKKAEHRAIGSHNTDAFMIGIVGEWAHPLIVDGDMHHNFDQIVQKVKVASSAPKAKTQRVTPALLAAYVKAQKEAAKRTLGPGHEPERSDDGKVQDAPETGNVAGQPHQGV